MLRKHSKLTNTDLHWVVTTLPRAVRNVLVAFPEQVFLAGGYIRSRISNTPVNDIDLIVGSKEAARFVTDILAGDRKVWTSENAFTVLGGRPTVQVVHRWTFDSPEQAIDSFDFTIACAAVWHDGHSWRSVCHEHYYADLAGKRLVYLSPQREEEPGGSLLRVLKFYQKGFRIPLDSLAAVITRLLRGVDERQNPGIWGSELLLKKVLSGLLREVDPSIDPDHIAHLPGMGEDGAPVQDEGEEDAEEVNND